MRKFGIWVVAAGALFPLAVGCSQNPQVIRGQSPQGPQAMGGGPVMQGAPVGSAYCPPGMDGMPGGFCPPGMGGFGGGFGDSAYVRATRLNGPTSYNVYPTPCDVPPVVQYPYYTTKGPDDFLYDK